jgi:hypothetical protein
MSRAARSFRLIAAAVRKRSRRSRSDSTTALVIVSPVTSASSRASFCASGSRMFNAMAPLYTSLRPSLQQQACCASAGSTASAAAGRVSGKRWAPQFLQKAGVSRTRTVNSSSRPSSIANDRIHLAASGKVEKLPIGPTMGPSPGPTFASAVIELDIAVK